MDVPGKTFPVLNWRYQDKKYYSFMKFYESSKWILEDKLGAS